MIKRAGGYQAVSWKECEDRVREIAAVPGIDMIAYGHSDLSAQLGVHLDLEHPRTQRRRSAQEHPQAQSRRREGHRLDPERDGRVAARGDDEGEDAVLRLQLRHDLDNLHVEFEQHLGRLTSYLESAYQHVSSELKHEIQSSIPVVFYKTHSEFEQTNLFPDFVPEGVAAFTEPVRDRMVIPIDEPPDKLQGLITHELTHVFEFDLIPRSLIARTVPLWVDEGLADYERGLWDTLDLMMVRDAAVTEQVPQLSRAGGSGLWFFVNGRRFRDRGLYAAVREA